MIEGFDKEIDAILRKAHDGENVFAAANPPSAHLDADALSAFAENALPEKTKIFYTEHLADCRRCRKILSNIISLNAEAETSEAFSVDAQKIAAPVLPWYRRIFSFPNLAYSLGALVLVFGGLFGFIILQSSYQSEVSQMGNRNLETKNQPAISANTASNTATTSNTAPANVGNMVLNTNSASVYSSNSTAAANQTANTATSNSKKIQEKLPKEQKQDSEQTQESVAAVPQAAPTVETKSAEVPAERTPNPMARTERNKDLATENSTSENSSREKRKSTLDGLSSGASMGETMKIGGKTFTRRNNIWYDAEYRNQPVTNIWRGSDDYKKLDADLRQTVERLGGTVVIVWKNKAYQIQ